MNNVAKPKAIDKAELSDEVILYHIEVSENPKYASLDALRDAALPILTRILTTVILRENECPKESRSRKNQPGSAKPKE